MRILLSCLLLASTLLASAQKITISGKVVDKETGEPLVFASIGLQGKTVSTISNLQGDFDFHILNEMRNDILVIQMLGYKTFEAPAWTLLEDNNQLIALEKSTTFLEDVVITDSLLGGILFALPYLE